MAPWADRLAEAVRQKQSPLVVGIDPRPASLPAALAEQAGGGLPQAAAAFETFGKEVIDAVATAAAAVKPQAAFFEQLGPAGMAALHAVIQHARRRELLVILDGKRNDIGSTAAAYAEAYLGEQSPWQADCLTVSPYLGEDSLTPFVEVCRRQQAGVFILVKTSNPGGGQFQDRRLWSRDGGPSAESSETLYQSVADLVEALALETLGDSGFGAAGAVVGATYPDQLAELRQRMPHAWLLVPGFGAQGGSAADVAGGFDDRGLGAVVNSSRGVIFAYRRDEFAAAARRSWQEAVAAAAEQARRQLLEALPAGRLGG